jgi:hypothetical protein
MNPDDIAKSYDFLRQIDFFVRTNHVDMAKIKAEYDGLRALDPTVELDIGKLVMGLE